MSDFSSAYPNSRKIYIDGPQQVQVPMREIALSGGEAAVRVYDTSGPQEHDVEQGLPKVRERWVAPRREAARRAPG
jgi:phosphomethylpyrimidine synthase